jgi:hypothetical protein
MDQLRIGCAGFITHKLPQYFLLFVEVRISVTSFLQRFVNFNDGPYLAWSTR